MSRWTMPRAWAASSAIAIWHAEVHDLLDRQQASLDPLLHRPALEQLHDDERTAVFLAELVDRADVRMCEGGGEARFALEAREPRRLGVVFLAQELDRDLTIETEILRPVDDTHAALAELVEHAIMGNERLSHGWFWSRESGASESVVYQLAQGLEAGAVQGGGDSRGYAGGHGPGPVRIRSHAAASRFGPESAGF